MKKQPEWKKTPISERISTSKIENMRIKELEKSGVKVPKKPKGARELQKPNPAWNGRYPHVNKHGYGYTDDVPEWI